MNAMLGSITAEFTRYKALAEAAISQLEDAQLSVAPFAGGNSVATLGWHIGGNLRSRFTDFLTSDGEKPWRHREDEFRNRTVERAELLAHWERGWGTLFATLATLTDGDLGKTITIRNQPMSVHEALHRSLAHISYHVGQLVLVARSLAGDRWRFLSIPPGQSDAYNANPSAEKADAHAAHVRKSAGPG
jgi:uncharacterized damage-inducible protein DinB